MIFMVVDYNINLFFNFLSMYSNIYNKLSVKILEFFVTKTKFFTVKVGDFF